MRDPPTFLETLNRSSTFVSAQHTFQPCAAGSKADSNCQAIRATKYPRTQEACLMWPLKMLQKWVVRCFFITKML